MTTPFTVTVAGGSKAYNRRGSGAHMTLHRAECPIVRRAAENRPEFLSGWVTADGQVANDRRDQHHYDSGVVGMLAYAREHAEKAAAGESAYKVCGRCKPQEALT